MVRKKASALQRSHCKPSKMASSRRLEATEPLLDVVEAVLDGGMHCLVGLGLLEVSRIGALQGIQLLSVLVRGVAQALLDEGYSLLKRGLMRLALVLLRHHVLARSVKVKLSRLPFFLEAAVQLFQLGVGAAELLLVPVSGVAYDLLEVSQALLDGGVLHFPCLHIVGMLGMGGLHLCQLHSMLLHRVADQTLKVVHSVLYGRVVRVELLMCLHELLHSLLQVTMALLPRLALTGEDPVRSLEFLQLLAVLVRRVADSPLQVVHPLSQAGVVQVHFGLLLRQHTV
mmetsp:Transcript_58840/g.132377  ORF Transcript_58840/g.132377 Transcript_58840/m.132377 type:complete len:285 (+) Transcript_58840:61-915(+)